MNKKLIITSVIILLTAIVATYWILNWQKPVAQNNSQNSTQTQSSVKYINERYGFTFSLPPDWKDYSIVMSTWEGYKGSELSQSGPLILIRNPKWTSEKPYQDIPIMVFTPLQWSAVQRHEFYVSAAGVNPSLIGYNAEYVFGLPSRYNHAFPEGWQEVEDILKTNLLQPFDSFKNVSPDTKILVCAGFPNGSTQKLTETSRIFINLPKDIFPDKDKNLQFKTVSGNARASWVSNGGPYGEGFGAITSNCWSYYYEFDGTGRVDLFSQGIDNINYLVHFLVSSTQ
jgi:hypothetical protein